MSGRQTNSSGWRTVACGVSVVLLLASAAAGCSQSRTSANGNTNWLRACTQDAQCEEGATCECGVCTRACDNNAECDAELPGTLCESTRDRSLELACAGTGAQLEHACLAACRADIECAAVGDDASCEDGVCVLPGGRADTGAPADEPRAGNGAGQGAGSGATASPRLCAGAECSSGEVCCYLTGACFDPADAAACPPPSSAESAHLWPPGEPCGADVHCPQGEACMVGELCIGPGACASVTDCSFAGPAACGCDGVSYPDPESRCRAGARVATADAPCGVRHEVGAAGSFATGLPRTGCGRDADCSGGEVCCARTGHCYDPALPVLCSEPPEGTFQGCLEDAHCVPGSYCKRDGCEGPGGCAWPSEECDNRLLAVCGCDGSSYTNADCAWAAAVNVRHIGECMP